MDMVSNFSFVNTTDYVEYDATIELEVTNIVINSLLLFIGLCANIWMIWSVCKTWKSNSRLHFFLLPLSVADSLTLCARCGVEIGINVNFSWKGGYYTCIFVMMFMTCCPCLAHLILAFLNVDNTITIARNTSFKFLRIVLVLVALLTSIAASIPEGLIFTVQSYGNDICTFREDLGHFPYIYDVVFDVFHTFLPLVIMLVFGVVALVLWCAKKGKGPRDKMEGAAHEDMKTGPAVVLALVLDVFFLLCWGPETIMRRGRIHEFVAFRVVQVFRFLATANSFINPVIYAIFCCNTKKSQNVSQEL